VLVRTIDASDSGAVYIRGRGAMFGVEVRWEQERFLRRVNLVAGEGKGIAKTKTKSEFERRVAFFESSAFSLRSKPGSCKSLHIPRNLAARRAILEGFSYPAYINDSIAPGPLQFYSQILDTTPQKRVLVCWEQSVPASPFIPVFLSASFSKLPFSHRFS
jgi:hypothetical protein